MFDFLRGGWKGAGSPGYAAGPSPRGGTVPAPVVRFEVKYDRRSEVLELPSNASLKYLGEVLANIFKVSYVTIKILVRGRSLLQLQANENRSIRDAGARATRDRRGRLPRGDR